MTARDVETALREKSNVKKAAFFPQFFKTGPGEYAERDQFLGVVVPDQRVVAKRFKRLSLDEIETLLHNPFHECRLTAVLILVSQYESATTESARKKIYDFYLRQSDQINNWDLVDSSAHKIVGRYLLGKSHQPLFKLARAKHLWKNRIAMIATLHFIRNDEFDTTLELAALLLNHPHDLIHKAVGWMLREMGQRNMKVLEVFLNQNAAVMPRTMLRYAIEKLPAKKRLAFIKMKPAK